MPQFRNPFPAFLTARPAAWIGTSLSLAIGLLFYLGTLKSIEDDAGQRFAGHARNAQGTISARLKSYSDVLRGMASLFSTTEHVTRAQFHTYVEGLGLPLYFPAIASINFARSFSDPERAAIERSLQEENPPDPGTGTPFKIYPPGRRAEYSVLVFVEPPATWANMLGLDLAFNPLVRPSLTALRDTGVLVSSGMPIAAMSGPNRTGLAMRLPVYRPRAPIVTLEQRRQGYLGSVGLAFNVQQLVQGVLAEMPIKNVRLTLIDQAIGVDQRRGRVLFDSIATATNPAPLPVASGNRFSNTLLVDFNGRTWQATFSVARRDMYSGFEEYLPWLAALAGFVTTMLLYALFQAMSRSRQRAITLAKGMTRELRESQAKLQLSHQSLRRLAAHAEQIKEGERKRIAREIHDDLGQNLLALRIEVDMLAMRTREHHPRLHARARATLMQIDATIRSVRQIINDLRPNVLDLGLSAAVEWQIGEFERCNGIACVLIDEHQEFALHDHCATAFFRILQESLSNIVRHAHASAVRVELNVAGNRLSMTVSDNGVGLQANMRQKSGSFGLVGIEERIRILGGSFGISSASGAGTTVCISVPLDQRTQHDAQALRIASGQPALA
ncbi:MAG: CHASE domain-containing protein [Pseudomonadota bacterium]